MLEKICQDIRKRLQTDEHLNSKNLPYEIQKTFSALQRLASLGIVKYETIDTSKWILTDDGSKIVESGSPERNLLDAVAETGTSFSELKRFSLGIPFALENGWISRGADGLVYKKIDEPIDAVQHVLANIDNLTDENLIRKLKKRKLIASVKEKCYIIQKGPEFTTGVVQQATDVTSEMIVNKSYHDFTFKNYNYDTLGAIPEKGNLHPLSKMRDQIAKIFLSMGFQEMQTNRWVESSFWNFDALFQPQDHPSRDAHDTFFVKNELPIDACPEYVHRVAAAHEGGVGGSEGYKNTWNTGEAHKLVLRTHTTAISARYLYCLAQMLFRSDSTTNKMLGTQNNEISSTASPFNHDICQYLHPQETYKFFSIDKVFRNETADATHLAEFHQIEGVIVGQNLTLGQLMGVLQEFYKKLGLNKLKFKPAFNPYTEPSMEIFGYHEGLQKWIEIGNSGIFRPEMLLPMGFDESYTVFGWGLSLERPTMIKYNISNIRDLVGHKVSLDFIKKSEICLI